jgi:hypothetical protein
MRCERQMTISLGTGTVPMMLKHTYDEADSYAVLARRSQQPDESREQFRRRRDGERTTFHIQSLCDIRKTVKAGDSAQTGCRDHHPERTDQLAAATGTPGVLEFKSSMKILMRPPRKADDSTGSSCIANPVSRSRSSAKQCANKQSTGQSIFPRQSTTASGSDTYLEMPLLPLSP